MSFAFFAFSLIALPAYVAMFDQDEETSLDEQHDDAGAKTVTVGKQLKSQDSTGILPTYRIFAKRMPEHRFF